MSKLKIQNTYFKIFIPFVVSTFYFLLFTTKVSAQALIPLQVSPARQQIELSPGESGAFDVKFYNLTENPMPGIIKVADFIVTDKDGSPRIIDDISQASPRFSASSWISIPYEKVALAKNDILKIQARIKVPSSARPGGRYVAVYFEPSVAQARSLEEINKEGALGISPRIASLIFIKVKGQITEQAIASKFFASRFQEYGPIEVSTEILNRGDYHIRPRGVLTLSNMFSGLVDQSKLEELNIFPDASREYSNKLGTKWMFGKYKINLSASYGEAGKAITQSMYVYVLPWRVIAIILIALTLLIILGRHFYQNLIRKQHKLSEELEKESNELDALKEELRRRNE